MLVMILACLIAAAGAAFIGWLSLEHTKLFVGLFFASISIIFFAIKLLIPFAAVASGGGLGNGTVWALIGILFNTLPDVVQNPILILPFGFFAGRISAWVFHQFFYVEPDEETKSERKTRILSNYGYSP